MITPTPANHNNPPSRPQWFDDLLMQYKPFMRQKCFRIAGNLLDYNEIYQDAVVLCLRHWYQFKPERPSSNFVAWTGFKCREAAAALRRACAKVEFTELGENIPDQSAGDKYSDVDRLLEFVSPEQAEAIMLSERGYSYAEIGAACGVTKQGIQLRILAGREIIRRKMKQADLAAEVLALQRVAANDNNDPKRGVA